MDKNNRMINQSGTPGGDQRQNSKGGIQKNKTAIF